MDQIKSTNFTPGEEVGVDSAKAPGVDAIDMNGSLYRLVPQKRPALASFMEHALFIKLFEHAFLIKLFLQ